ncbi:MAG TPA: hypothetical protein VN289_03655 [Paraburkholderia sp.]|jgi:hypothetical protein|nr:hypothetical protein [Paraburkholderia sp.]
MSAPTADWVDLPNLVTVELNRLAVGGMMYEAQALHYGLPADNIYSWRK